MNCGNDVIIYLKNGNFKSIYLFCNINQKSIWINVNINIKEIFCGNEIMFKKQ